MSDLSFDEEQDLKKLSQKDPDAPIKQGHYDFDKSVQQDILSLMMNERSFMIQAVNLIKPYYFLDKAHVEICKILMEWFDKHVKSVTSGSENWIQVKYIKEELSERLKDNPAKLFYLAELKTIQDCYVQGLTSRSYCLDKVITFAKDQEIRLAIAETIDLLNGKNVENKYDKIKDKWDRALLVGPQMDLGLNYFEDIDERYKRMAEDRSGKDRFSSGFAEIDEGIVGHGLSRGEIGGYEAMSGAGKCFGFNTPVLMFDCTIKMVQNIKEGELVMGEDGTPRKVLSTHTGRSMLYKVTPTKGDSYIVNSEHILCLKTKNGDVCNISVKDYLSESENFQLHMKGWRTGVDFDFKSVHYIDPYLLGFLLGDPNLSDNAGLLLEVSIPHTYKINSREVRLKFLAGLIDVGGIVSDNGFDYTTTSKKLAEDILFLARSLGFCAYSKKEHGCLTVSISGDCSNIPTKFKKYQAIKQVEDHLVHNISIEEIGVGDYYGFSVDGNHLFLLGDFTVVHNSWMLCKSAIENIRCGHRVLLVTLEMNQDKTAERFDTLFTGINMDNLLQQENFVKKKLNAEIKATLSQLESLIGNDKKRLVIKHFSAGSADVSTIKAYYSQLALHGFKPDLLIVDYIGEFRDFPGLKTYESRQRLMRDLRSFGVDEDHCTITALQANRSGRFAQDGGFIDDSEIGDSYGQIRNMDACWSINQTKKEKAANVGRIFVVKNRNGISRYHFCYFQDPITLNIRSITDEEFKDRVSAVKELKDNESPMDAIEIEDASKFIPNGSSEEQ